MRPRSAGFFGLHFDFHCAATAKRVGGRTTPAMVAQVLKQVRPDYVQVDCKGHPGISSYPTRAGIAAKDIVRDQLAIWRRMTRRSGVALVVHYSGVWDSAAIQRHPDWAARDHEGKPGPNATSVFGPYVDDLMIPQLAELAATWKVDAAWVDGDCWGAAKDWSTWSKAAWRRTHGKAAMPTDPKDPLWLEFLDHCRAGFRAYLARYVDAAHAARPGFEIASNWAYSSHMPEPVATAVDFISGDFSPVQSVQSARFQGRCLMHQGRPWDLMAWGFGCHYDGAHSEKSAVQLCQEAALVLTLGGGFQVYTTQQPDAYVAPARLPVLAEVARFCRARQELCHRAESASDVAVLYSHEDWRRRSGAPFPGNWDGLADIEGALRLGLDTRRSCDLILDHQVAERLDRYRVLVLPDCHHLADDLRRRLESWLRAGGGILVLGPNALAALALPGLPVSATAEIAQGVRYLHDPLQAGGAGSFAVKESWQTWKTGRGAKVLHSLRPSPDPDSPATPGAVLCRVGRGRLIAVAAGLGRSYQDRRSSVCTALAAAWLRHLDPKPLIEVEGPGRIEVVAMRKAGELRVHLTNLEGPHDARQVMVWDHLPPVGPLQMRLRLPQRATARWAPDGGRLSMRRSGDHLIVTTPAFALHGAVCVAIPAAAARRRSGQR